MYFHKLKIIIIFVVLSIVLVQNSKAQDNTMYFMHSVPQTTGLNPAIQYRCRDFIELPVISSLKYAYNNSWFSFENLIHEGEGELADSFIVDLDYLADNLFAVSSLRNTLDFNIMGAGYGYRKFYFTFNISNHSEARIGVARDVISFFVHGNWDPENDEARSIDLSGIAVNGFNYTGISAGASYKFNNRLTAGIKIKRLWGAANFNTRYSELVLETEQNPIALNFTSEYRVNCSVPVEITYDSLGIIADVQFNSGNYMQDFIFNKNRGWAVDVGVIYRYSERITVMASVVDLGYINWRTNVNNFLEEGDFSFIGFDLKDYENIDQQSLFETLIDSLKHSFQFTNSETTYKTMLSAKVFAGATYYVNEWLNFGLLTNTIIFDKLPHPTVTLSANINPVQFLSATLSYSYMNRSFNNLGFALALGRSGVQFYFASDNIPLRYNSLKDSPVMWPSSARTFNFRIGLNILFGCKKTHRSFNNVKINQKYCPAYN